MATTEDYWIGQISALAGGKPLKLSVRYQLFEPDSADPTNEWPHYYTFSVSERSPDLLDQYELKMTNTEHYDYLRDSETRNRFAVTYGIQQIQATPKQRSFNVKSEVFKKWEHQPKVTGVELEHRILDFVFRWYQYLPQESFAYPDLMINLKADEREIRQRLTVLYEKKFLIRGKKRSYDGRLGFRISTVGFRLNPEKDSEVRKWLEDVKLRSGTEHSQSRVFISYNNIDKALAGEISDILESTYDVKSFLAHQKIPVSEEWRLRILKELARCDLLIALVTKDFPKSKWTDQEVGIALGKGKKIVPILVNKKLHGFLEGFQGKQLADDLPKLVKEIASDLNLVLRK